MCMVIDAQAWLTKGCAYMVYSNSQVKMQCTDMNCVANDMHIGKSRY